MQLQQILFEIRQKFIAQIEWLPAHCDILLHDMADALAVESACDAVLVL